MMASDHPPREGTLRRTCATDKQMEAWGINYQPLQPMVACLGSPPCQYAALSFFGTFLSTFFGVLVEVCRDFSLSLSPQRFLGEALSTRTYENAVQEISYG